MPERIQVVVTVKAYPSVSVKYGESVCVAGIRTDTEAPQWVRLYPVEYRDLPVDRRVAKYEEIALQVSPSSDTRPESLRPDTTTIEVQRKITTGKDRKWSERAPRGTAARRSDVCRVGRGQGKRAISWGVPTRPCGRRGGFQRRGLDRPPGRRA